MSKLSLTQLGAGVLLNREEEIDERVNVWMWCIHFLTQYTVPGFCVIRDARILALSMAPHVTREAGTITKPGFDKIVEIGLSMLIEGWVRRRISILDLLPGGIDLIVGEKRKRRLTVVLNAAFFL